MLSPTMHAQGVAEPGTPKVIVPMVAAPVPAASVVCVSAPVRQVLALAK